MDLGLAGKVAIVTGGARASARRSPRSWRARGWTWRSARGIGACSRRRRRPWRRPRGAASCRSSAIRPARSRFRISWKRTVAQLGRVDILVNNASTPGGVVTGPLASADDELLLEDINTKVVGYMRCAKAAAPHMQRSGWGRIVNIGGLSGRRAGNISGLRNAAIVHLTNTLADQLGASGITVNLVHPGATRTERTDAETERRARRMRFDGLLTRRRLRRSSRFWRRQRRRILRGWRLMLVGGLFR